MIFRDLNQWKFMQIRILHPYMHQKHFDRLQTFMQYLGR